MVQKNKISKIKGKVVKTTTKAVLINLQPDREIWFPKSTIHSKNDLSLLNTSQEFLVDSWTLEKNDIPLDGDFFIQKVKTSIKEYHKDNLIALYGIGSYFNNDLPPSWEKNDVDLILIMKSIEDIPKEAWERRFKSRDIDNHEVYLGYNTIEMYQNKEAFKKYSGVNYKWALLDIKNEENSTLLYGDDIHDKLPEINNIKFDYDDILARVLYHIEKSLKENDEKNAKSEFSKAVFKFSYYLCVFFDESFPYTSIIKIINKLESVVQIVKNIQKIIIFLKEAVNVRSKGIIRANFTQLHENFIKFILSLLEHGGLHKKFSIPELNDYLIQFFGGFPLLKRFLKELH
ncbi:hypothetical protein LCGC14_1051260 [marine sediment metagenome]|uniref:Uncharacterized protein n=1 Tax=marine sediment metagenome TaxID=412755 RepID=A0A0F9QUT8_9ZZZZ